MRYRCSRFLRSRSSSTTATMSLAGTSLALGDRGWLILTAIIAAIAILQLAYAWAMRNVAFCNENRHIHGFGVTTPFSSRGAA